MYENRDELIKALGQVLTLQYDYPPNGMGSLGYKGLNLYRFSVDDIEKINDFIYKRSENYSHSYNVQMLAQEIITDLLDQGLIEYSGYGFKKQQKESHSI